MVPGGSAWSRGGGLPGPSGVCMVPGGLPGPRGWSAWSGGDLPDPRGWSGLPGLGGGLPGPGGSAWSGGCLPGGGVCPVWGGVCQVGGSAWSGGWVVSQHALRQTPPVNGMTDGCKNITLATTSLRPVIMV